MPHIHMVHVRVGPLCVRQIRVLFLYARSATLPVLTEHIGAPLAIDVIYMHEKPVAGVNCPQEVGNMSSLTN